MKNLIAKSKQKIGDFVVQHQIELLIYGGSMTALAASYFLGKTHGTVTHQIGVNIFSKDDNGDLQITYLEPM